MPSPLPHRPPRRRPSGGERVFADDAGRLWSAALHSAPPSDGRGAAPRGAPSDAPGDAPRDAAARGAPPSAVLVFTCISDARQPLRAIAVDGAVVGVADAADEALRGWLREAPAMGLLT